MQDNDNFSENNQDGKMDGFDFAEPISDSTKGSDEKTAPSGYTVTPNGGFYHLSKDEIPNDEPITKNSYFPSGNYSDNQAENSNSSWSYNSDADYKPYTPPSGDDGAKSAESNNPQNNEFQYNSNYKTDKKKSPKTYGLGTVIAVALIVSVAVSAVFGVLMNYRMNSINTDGTSGETVKTTDKVVEINGSIEELAAAAANKASGSVVGVQTTFAVQSFFSGESTSTGSGSGVIYKSDGYIITNYHVIADTLESNNSTITVYLNNANEKGYKAAVINYNISCDLAVLKIDKTGLDAIEIADSDALNVGQYCLCIGSPAGLEFMGSTSFGIISGLNRQLSTTDGNMKLIQTDAAINPGNSGGALVNTKGQLIGISSSKLVSESYEGMGFAIPSKTVKKICDNLIAHEGEGEPYTGISISSNYTSEVLTYYGYPVGAVVAGVDRGSPAEKAGIKRGDIITEFGDTKISEYTMYDSALSNYYKGDKVKVKYYRSGRNYTTTLVIASGN